MYLLKKEICQNCNALLKHAFLNSLVAFYKSNAMSDVLAQVGFVFKMCILLFLASCNSLPTLYLTIYLSIKILNDHIVLIVNNQIIIHVVNLL